jgi:hypothetical protein
MVTGARYLAWAFGTLAVLFAPIPVSYLLTGRPEFTFNGEVVRSPGQAIEALFSLLVLMAGCAAIVLATSKSVIARSNRYSALVSWLESEPVWPSIGVHRFYVVSLLAGLAFIALIPGASMKGRFILVLCLPFMFPLGWGMVWAVLGFQLINPINWFFPQVLRFGAYFFLFTTWVSVALSPLSLAGRAADQPEAALLLPCTLGSAVAAGHFLRFWLQRAFDISGPPGKADLVPSK